MYRVIKFPLIFYNNVLGQVRFIARVILQSLVLSECISKPTNIGSRECEKITFNTNGDYVTECKNYNQQRKLG